MKTAERARGKWRGILLSLGVDERYLTAKHGPCPFCEGRDRFRWDNQDAKGTFYCSQCGAGDGIEFAKRFKGWTFQEAASAIDKICGVTSIDPHKKSVEPDDKQRRQMLNRLWAGAVPIDRHDLAGRYLIGRKVFPENVPSCLRFAKNCPIPSNGGFGPAMIALVHSIEGQAVQIHRTFLGPNGKANMDNPRALMNGKFPDGAAVRLARCDGLHLGIAEGIETALAASIKFRLPVWAALNANNLEKWTPPDGITHVTVFGDCDESFTGQAAAYVLARRLKTRMRINTQVRIPDVMGKDWADGE